nr:DUF5693 family protein [Paenibacillus sediminis]
MWVIVVIGIIAALPVIYDRMKTESSSKKVEIVFDYRDLVDIADFQPKPADFINEQLDKLKQAGVSTMALYDSTLDELQKSRRIMIYSSKDVANLTQSVLPVNENFTYILFTNKEYERTLSPIITETFTSLGIEVSPWTFHGQAGLLLKTSPEDAMLKPMQPDPITMQMLHDKGFIILPRLADTIPYNQAAMEKLFDKYEAMGVKRILFDGDSVKGYNDNAKMNSLAAFAEVLNKHGIGIAAIENLKKPQLGFNKLAYLTHYNVVRLYSLSDADASLDVDTIADRFALATKDRNIRMLYLNAGPTRDLTKAEISNPLDNLIKSLDEPGASIDRIKQNGFELGQAEPFKVVDSSWQRYLKLIVAGAGVAFVALCISYFIPGITLIAFVLGLVGSSGLFLLSSHVFEQALALFVAISGPTIAMVLAVRKVRKVSERSPNLPAGKRLAHAVVLFITTSLTSLMAVPYVIALLNNVTYQLRLDQFRGVSLLHAAPIGLVALYIFLYRGKSVTSEIRKVLRMPITVLWVIAVAVIGVIGLYYLSRTGNNGTVSPLEMSFRSFLENTFHVRPRTKEFLMGHPLFVAGVFVALKYRRAIIVLIIGAIGQLSMVDTFAHIHTPVILSIIRDFLGMGLGLIIGLIFVGVLQIAERCWHRWSPRLLKP